MKPYRVDFRFNLESEASTYVIANNEEEAAAGAMMVISQTDSYSDPEVTKVAEVKKEKESDDQSVTIN